MPKELTCPLGHTCDACLWQVRLRGLDPQTGHEIDDAKCAIAWMPTLLIEVAGVGRQAAAAAEGERNATQDVVGVLARLVTERRALLPHA